jgi:hypothetical protein
MPRHGKGATVRSKKGLFALGAMTALPLAYLVGVTVFVAVDARTTPADLLARFGWPPLLLPNLAVFVLILGLMIGYVGDILRTPAIAEDNKPLWVAVLVVGHVFAMAAYWLLYMFLPWRAGQQLARRPAVAVIRRPVPMGPRRGRAPVRREATTLEAADREG